MNLHELNDQALAAHIKFVKQKVQEGAVAYKSQLTEALTEHQSRLDELSKHTLGKYVGAAHSDIVNTATSNAFLSGRAGDKYNKADETDREVKRQKGIGRAMNRLTREETEEIEERRQVNSSQYSDHDDQPRKPSRIKMVPNKDTDSSKTRSARRNWSNLKEAATDDKNPTAHGAEKPWKLDGRGTDKAVINRTGSSTFAKNPSLLGRNADVESGKQWMVSFVNGIPDCLVPGETETEVTTRMRMIMSNPQMINQVSNTQMTTGSDKKSSSISRARKIAHLGEGHTIDDQEFELIEDVPFFNAAGVIMAALNAGANQDLLEDLEVMLEGAPDLSWNNVVEAGDALGLDDGSILAICAHLKAK